ncbi:MAG: amidohydrolase [Deltaproteobacteria bacterium]|nr:amidohydrolase [Deltaproteobacteria bacterium]
MAALHRWGADAACAFGFPFTDIGKSRLCNDYALEAARENPGRVIPFACVNPLAPGAAAEAGRCLAAGARGVGEIATYGEGLGPDVRRAMAPLAELCREAGVPLLLHTNEPIGHEYAGKCHMELSEIYALVKAHPGTKWILAHWGAGLFAYGLLKKEVDDVLRNCTFDTSAGPYLYKPSVYRHAIDLAGADRVVFGSDYPLLGLPRYRRDMEEAGLSEEEKAAILGGNLARVLGIGAP